MTDWNNIDLELESHLNLIEAYSFDDLLLEVNCNLKIINRDTVTAQFKESLQSSIIEAKEVFQANLDAIVSKAIKTREEV